MIFAFGLVAANIGGVESRLERRNFSNGFVSDLLAAGCAGGVRFFDELGQEDPGRGSWLAVLVGREFPGLFVIEWAPAFGRAHRFYVRFSLDAWVRLRPVCWPEPPASTVVDDLAGRRLEIPCLAAVRAALEAGQVSWSLASPFLMLGEASSRLVLEALSRRLAS